MARIRTIKPEFPQSESMGRVSRDARLCFVLLWTLADDEGRLRGNSRMLASLLFPYDDDAPGMIDVWIAELEGEGCVTRYQVEGTTYMQIAKWLSHQKIDRPSQSKFPAPEEGSQILAKARESSSADQGSRIKDQGPGKGGDLLPATAPPPPARRKAEGQDETPLQAACRATWQAYCDAFYRRYGTEPIRNAKVNSQVKQLCQALPHEEAPHVAAFYVAHNDAFYVRKGHDMGLLVTDSAKLRMEWATGRQMTGMRARQEERAGSMLSIVDEIARERGELGGVA